METEGPLSERNHQKQSAEDEKQRPTPSATPRVKRENKKQYVIMMKPSIHDEAMLNAADQGLSFSALLEQLLKDYLKK
ncbi:hypothetical protein FEFB_16530 [Fructobacillus sp. EFB-N1]|uniref:hypothetical protein n=1 Tax=Fructobacillus sp. EFB-N1 TaxID=1658766 RepID=UPI00064D9AEA|nr:hypothetical protein [Fructobacillus sp. EFB-N1]KMK52621.1 hypothetical protein FEFB_16530 [Fructobacillus sp. EFB-N1]